MRRTIDGFTHTATAFVHHISRRQFIARGVRGAATFAIVPIGAGTADAPCFSSFARSSRQAVQLRDLERLILELMGAAAVPGVSIAVIKDASVVWHRELGVRDAASRAPVDEQTLFEAASVSKTVFAYAVMQLVDRKVLALDAPLTTYVPDRILDGDPRLAAITARHVLSHTSGLPNFRSRDDPLRIHFTPGTRYEYSGEGYWYLQSVMTHLAGKVDSRACGEFEAGLEVCATDIDAYLKATVLEPLGMRTSSYVWNDVLAQHKARPHDSAGKPLTMGKPTAVAAARYASAGGLHTTALEYANFLIEVIAPRAEPTFRLSEAARREMMRRQVQVDAKRSWGLGWEIPNAARGLRIQHQGGQSGFQAFAAALVDRRSGYVILTNSDNGWKVFYNERFTALIDRLLAE